MDHAVQYVDGKIHTNGLENEQAYRFNNRKITDGERFSAAVKGIVGKRVTFNELTGKTGAAQL